MKKIFALMLILGALLAFVSCGNKECEKHVDESPVDGICDVCGKVLNTIEPGDLPIVPAF